MGFSSFKSCLLVGALFSSSVFAQSIPESAYESPLSYVTTFTQVYTPTITICEEGDPAHCIYTVSVGSPVTQTEIGYIASASFCVYSDCASGLVTPGTGVFLSALQPRTTATAKPSKSTAATAKSTAAPNNKPTQTANAGPVGGVSTTAAPTVSMSKFHNAGPVATAGPGAALAAAGAMGFAAALL